MKTHPNRFFLRLCMLLLSASLAFAQPAPIERTVRVFSQQELDQMLAPIALYPDALLSQILMAATYPLEVVKAAHWSAENRSLVGDQAVQAVRQTGWDPSVQSLVAFPDLLAKMEENIDWTERLGDAFLAQQPQVMDTVQNLRRRAMAQGSLASSERIVVTPQAQAILIEPANPQIVYVPYYDPNIVYGTWWWPNSPPVYWAPWPGYYAPPIAISAGPQGYVTTTTSAASALIWGSAIIVGTEILFGGFDWHRHRVHADYDRQKGWPDRRPPTAPGRTPNVWQHDPSHRHGLPYDGKSMRPTTQPPRNAPVPVPPPSMRGTVPFTTTQPPHNAPAPVPPASMRGTVPFTTTPPPAHPTPPTTPLTPLTPLTPTPPTPSTPPSMTPDRQDFRSPPQNPHGSSIVPQPSTSRPSVVTPPPAAALPVPAPAPAPKSTPRMAPLPSASPGIMRSGPPTDGTDSGAESRSPRIFNQARTKGGSTANDSPPQEKGLRIFRQ